MGSAYNDGNWTVFSHQWRNTDGRLLMHLDGTQAGSGTLNSGATLDAGGAFAIGGEQDAVDGGYEASQAFQGDIAEVIVYGSSLKKAERTVVENYLAQKYGLDANLPTDLYTPSDASYIVGMSGMGKESDGTTELNSSGLVITQNGNFVDGDYVFAAHDGTANAVNSTPNTLHAEVEAAWQRDWYVDKTGTVNVKLAFDFSTGICSLANRFRHPVQYECQ
ncbi:MAG: LamG-like jellyroll fold domain-containing protein [Cyclobacterium sp.]|uniref:LamG-like jellyroll fold domain-containing protein n=1 Tax=Cyclobacterium sp. TaxID=1966343 RepID=UPI00397109D7